MAIDVANAGRYVFYLNFRTLGTGDNLAESEQLFSFAQLIDDSSKYILSIERFRIPLQTIPMVSTIPQAIIVTPKGAGVPTVIPVADTYSYFEFRQQINLNNQNLFFSLTSDGRAVLDFNFANDTLVLDPVIADIFDMNQVLGLALGGQSRIIGGSPIFDRFDQLYKIQIEARSGLSGVQQEIIDTNTFGNLLTDFIIPSNWGLSGTSQTGNIAADAVLNLTAPTRQDLEFNNAASRRYIMLRGNAPIQNVSIVVRAVYRDGTVNNIRLPPRSVLECKLGFWLK